MKELVKNWNNLISWKFLFLWIGWSLIVAWLTVKGVYYYHNVPLQEEAQALTYDGVFENFFDVLIHLEETSWFSISAVINVFLISWVIFCWGWVQRIVLPGYDEIRDVLKDWRVFRNKIKSEEGMDIEVFQAQSQYYGHAILAAGFLCLGSLILVAGVYIAAMLA